MPTVEDSRSATSNSGFDSDSKTSALGSTKDPPPIADPYNIDDPAAIKQIKKRMDERWRTANHRRWLFELSWLRNILFYLGIQWVRVDWPGREIRNLSLPTNFPRAITNKYAQVNDDLWSQLVQGDIPVNWIPSTDDTKDRTTADICEDIREVVDVETKVRSIKRDLGFWVTYAGNGFIEPYYDYDPLHGTTPIPLVQCATCGMTSKPGELDGSGNPPTPPKPCPKCTLNAAMAGLPAPPPQYAPATNPDGSRKTEDIPVGKLCFRVLSPFEVYWDNICRIGQTQHWYFTPHRYDVQKAKATFPKIADKINEGMNEPMRPSRNYLIAIAYAGSYLTGTTGTGEASAREEMRRQITAWEYREDPTEEYPQGVYAVRLGDDIAELSPLPNTWGAGRLQGQPFLGLVHFHQKISGGAWAKAVATDLVSIQARRNIIDSNLQLTAQRTGAPKLMSPVGSGIKNVTGEAGQWVEYKPITFGGTSLAEPHYLEAALGNVQPLLELIKMLDDMQETLAGTRNVTGGDVPSGVTAASALAFLNEKANRALTPLKEQWADSWGLVYQYAIEIIRKHWTDERILAILGRNKEWQFEKFKAADLTGAVNVSIDYEALFPKSQATERANLMQLTQMGFLQPGDPNLESEVLESFGATRFKKSIEDARLQAIREFDAFMENGTPPIFSPLIQNSPIHLQQHIEDAMTQEFEQLMRTQPVVQTQWGQMNEQAAIWVAHIQSTQEAIMAAQVAQAAPPGPSAPPAGHPGSQKGSQRSSAEGNAKGPAAPIKKGEAAADNGPGGAGAAPGPPPPG